jgi:hypothetical protein
MASSDGVRDLFATPRVLAADGGEPGELLLRSAGELGEYPVTVVHGLREWAGDRSRTSFAIRTGPW